MTKFLLIAVCSALVLNLTVAQEEKKCDMHKKICDLAKDMAGAMKFKTCFETTAPPFFRDITNKCKEENGEKDTPIEELIKKICDEANKDLAHKIGKCKKAGMEAESEKNANMKTEIEPFMKCLG